MANAVLGAGAVAVGTWFFAEVKPAAADSARLKPVWAAAAKEQYERRGDPRSIQTAPVSKEALETVDRPDYRALTYWIFSGPLPPAPRSPDSPVEVVKGPEGLAALGRPKFILYVPPSEGQPVAADSVVSWLFGPNKTGQFKPGEFIAEAGAAKRFKLVNIRRSEPGVSKFVLVYEVYDDPKGSPVKTDEYIHDATPPREDGRIRPLGPPAGAVPGAPGGAAAGLEGTAGAVVEGTGAAAVLPPGAPEGDAALPAPAVSDGPRRAATVRKVNPNLYEVEFDDERLYDEWAGRKIADVAETVKTQPVTDPRTGRPMGIKITGISADTPADWFDVRPGDVLVSINGQAVTDRADAVRIAQNLPRDVARVSVVIDRNGRKITYNIDPRDPRTRRQARHLQPLPGR
jgi:hypothetical protein